MITHDDATAIHKELVLILNRAANHAAAAENAYDLNEALCEGLLQAISERIDNLVEAGSAYPPYSLADTLHAVWVDTQESNGVPAIITRNNLDDQWDVIQDSLARSFDWFPESAGRIGGAA